MNNLDKRIEEILNIVSSAKSWGGNMPPPVEIAKSEIKALIAEEKVKCVTEFDEKENIVQFRNHSIKAMNSKFGCIHCGLIFPRISK